MNDAWNDREVDKQRKQFRISYHFNTYALMKNEQKQQYNMNKNANCSETNTYEYLHFVNGIYVYLRRVQIADEK